MAAYRKKPVVLDAVQFLPKQGQTFPVPTGVKLWPDERGKTPANGSWGYVDSGTRQHVFATDWILTNAKGGITVINDDDFKMNYEPAPVGFTE